MSKKFYLLLIILAAVYIVLTFTTPPDPSALQRYSMTVLQSRLLSLTIVVPLLFIWLCAFYGFIGFQEYAAVIRDAPEGRGLQRLAAGLTVLGVGLVLQSVITSALNYGVRTGARKLKKIEEVV